MVVVSPFAFTVPAVNVPTSPPFVRLNVPPDTVPTFVPLLNVRLPPAKVSTTDASLKLNVPPLKVVTLTDPEMFPDAVSVVILAPDPMNFVSPVPESETSSTSLPLKVRL
jgi:hypothetical protein